MTCPINPPDVLNNGAFVKESSEGLFHRESVYLFSPKDGVLSPPAQSKPLNPDNLCSDETAEQEISHSLVLLTSIDY